VIPAVPVSVQHAIVQRVPHAFTYMPTRLPRGWRYRDWDAGRETPQLFRRGHGLNIWFTTSQPSGGGFHVFVDRGCRLDRPLRTFRFGRTRVAWSTTFGDERAWRCIRTPGGTTLRILLSFIGSPIPDLSVAARTAAPIARTLATVERIP
jgi:hypothetical protein